ncbi:ribonuclease 3-like protein 3 [Salvia miltiorrhiza]|uniref:ribonuclease 3-like protein 3 n=1 Tax=Salvia miltiorrhiza TaxID=226208 RepID=UPI0025AD56A9|nr:ribonuclease 3-like protein 3 [Salvia miltiorrhiza]
MASLWGSLFFPAKNLRRYGNILCNYLKSIKARKLGLSLIEAENKTLQNLKEVERIIGYRFNNRSLLCEAFTHPSCQRGCVSYERLEYIGDSVLNLLITKEQFSKYPSLEPGLLTPLRAANVDNEKLARVAVQHKFHRYIRFGAPIYERKIQAFINALPTYPLHSHGLINAPKVLADVVESTIGAVFVDSNYSIDTTWEVASDLMEPIITPKMLEKNPVKKLVEICQKHKLKVKIVDLWSQEGTYKVFVDGKLRGKGTSHAKKTVALNRAANAAYNEVLLNLSPKDLNEGQRSLSWLYLYLSSHGPRGLHRAVSGKRRFTNYRCTLTSPWLYYVLCLS